MPNPKWELGVLWVLCGWTSQNTRKEDKISGETQPGKSEPNGLTADNRITPMNLNPAVDEPQRSQRGKTAINDPILKSGNQEEKRWPVPEFLSSKSKSSLTGMISWDSGTRSTARRSRNQ